MNGSAFAELIQRSSFIFAGTVSSTGQSSVDVLAAQPDLAVVRFNRGFLVNPVLGKLAGRPITVRLAHSGAGAGAVRQGQQLIFFTTAWVHGKEIAVGELGRVAADTKTEEEVARAVAALPELHLQRRIATAVLIVHGVVTEIERATDIPGTASEHDPAWMRASIEVREVLKGPSSPAGGGKRASGRKRARASLLFPGSRDIAFRDSPRVSLRQEAVFLLHRGDERLPAADLIAPDPADVQPQRTLRTIRRLSGGSATPPE